MDNTSTWIKLLVGALSTTALTCHLRLGISDRVLRAFRLGLALRTCFALAVTCLAVITLPGQYLVLSNAIAFWTSFRRGKIHKNSLLRSIFGCVLFWLLHGLQSGFVILLMTRFPRVRT